MYIFGPDFCRFSVNRRVFGKTRQSDFPEYTPILLCFTFCFLGDQNVETFRIGSEIWKSAQFLAVLFFHANGPQMADRKD